MKSTDFVFALVVVNGATANTMAAAMCTVDGSKPTPSAPPHPSVADVKGPLPVDVKAVSSPGQEEGAGDLSLVFAVLYGHGTTQTKCEICEREGKKHVPAALQKTCEHIAALTYARTATFVMSCARPLCDHDTGVTCTVFVKHPDVLFHPHITQYITDGALPLCPFMYKPPHHNSAFLCNHHVHFSGGFKWLIESSISFAAMERATAQSSLIKQLLLLPPAKPQPQPQTQAQQKQAASAALQKEIRDAFF